MQVVLCKDLKYKNYTIHRLVAEAYIDNVNNYKMVKAGVRGESTGFTLLGILPLVAPSYADAKANLYANTGENLTGRSIALANQTEDKSGINLLIFQVPKVTITADVVEFTEKSQRRPSSSDERSQKP
jgi:hypothetical protein